MYFIYAKKTIPVDFSVEVQGDGYWNPVEAKGIIANFHELEINIKGYPTAGGLHWYGYVDAKHDVDGEKYGLLYTDSVEMAVAKEIKLLPELDYIIGASGSEQGMQDRFILSMDISIREEYFTVQKLLKMGFLVEETYE